MKAKKGLSHHVRQAMLPSRSNNHHPHILKREVVVGVLCAALILEVAVLGQAFLLFKTPYNLASVLPAVVASLTNDQRTENDIPTLVVSPELSQAAQEKADDMAAKGYFSHVSPDGTLPWHWFDQVGYNYQFAGENLAINFTDSTDVVNAWMASPMHRANILKQDYTEEGIGMASGMYQGHSTIFVVQFFAKPELAGGTHAAVATAAPKPSPVASVVRDVKVALHDVPAKTVPAPTELMAIDASNSAAGTGTPQVLGVETAPSGTAAGAVAPAASSPSFLQKLLASPFTTAGYVFGMFAGLIFAILIAALVYRKRLPRLSATIGGLSLAVVLLGFVAVNVTFFTNKTTVGTASQTNLVNSKV